MRPNLDVKAGFGFASFALADGFAASDCVVVVAATAFPRAFPRGEFTFGANALSRLTCTRSVGVVAVGVVDPTRPRSAPTAPAPGDSSPRPGVDAPDARSAIARDAMRVNVLRSRPTVVHGDVVDRTSRVRARIRVDDWRDELYPYVLPRDPRRGVAGCHCYLYRYTLKYEIR